MTAEEMWRASGLKGAHTSWAFGDDSDGLAELVKRGIKTATCSALVFYRLEHEALPEAGAYSVILDSKNEAVCIVRTTRVYLTPFDQVTRRHAFKEGEGDRSLAYWRKAHKRFFADELKAINQPFDEKMTLVCEEFERVYPVSAEYWENAD